MLVQDLNKTKEELEKKKQEIEELEKENLNFSEVSHSIAHKQKSLEYKLNKLMSKNEMGSEIDIRDRLDAISKEAFKETTAELSKTDIVEIDDMLNYMQSECTKNTVWHNSLGSVFSWDVPLWPQIEESCFHPFREKAHVNIHYLRNFSSYCFSACRQ